VQLYEAAQVDGASGWQQFRNITIPLLTPVIMMVTLVNLILTMNDFTIVYSLTRGGPAGSTELIATLAYKIAFVERSLGKAATIPMLQFPFLIALIFIVWRASGKRVEL